MMAYEWFKCHQSLFHDAKHVAMSDREFRIWLGLISAAMLTKDGVIRGTMQSIARSLNTNSRSLRACFDSFSTEFRPRIIVEGDAKSLTEPLAVTLVNLNEYQSRKPSDQPEQVRERVARHRENKDILEAAYRVTSPIDKTRIDKKEKESSKAALLPCLQKYTPKTWPADADGTPRPGGLSAHKHVTAEIEGTWGMVSLLDLAAFWDAFTDSGKCERKCGGGWKQKHECMWLALDKLRIPMICEKASLRAVLRLVRKICREDRVFLDD